MAFQARITNVPNIFTFINAMADFAVANGSFTDEGSIAGVEVRIIKRGDIYWSFWQGGPHTSEYVSAVPMRSRMTYQRPTTVAELSSLPGQPTQTFFSSWKGAGPYISFYLYQTNHAVHGVLEVFPNVFVHYSFGVINKIGAFEGGEYISSHAPFYNYYVGGTQVYNFPPESTRNVYPFDGGYGEYLLNSDVPASYPGFIRHIQGGVKLNNDGDFAPIGSGSHRGKRAVMAVNAGPVDNLVYYYGFNSFNMRSVIMPIYVRSLDLSNTSVWFHLGEVPGVGFLNGRFIPEASLVDLNWQVFPIGSRENPADASTYQSPLRKSLAYLRV